MSEFSNGDKNSANLFYKNKLNKKLAYIFINTSQKLQSYQQYTLQTLPEQVRVN
ncbi:hypothetical protein H0I69_16755 [Yersinia enterocolitica]|uniref:hypothetical protein n=1 Tax=Yersinia enterocolitica TaxID=630 RepID=UPI001CA5C1E4|nr:hypothetical protein [Yersinia enterocolitica]MBW5869445.1 hypothetical protein [Yersinia enterocolitica]UXD23013.1 hypothetical protein FORC065_0073 [Yersinia enterocolitica]